MRVLKIALDGFIRNKIRTVLTLSGIIIGIASLISVISIGNAGEEKIMNELNKFGINRLMIYQNGGGNELCIDDIQMLEKNLGNKACVCPQSVWKTSINFGSKSVHAEISGTRQELMDIEYKELLCGRFIDDNDDFYKNKCIVLSENIAEELFDSTEKALGKTVEIKGRKFKVIGIEGSTKPLIDSIFSEKNYIPISTLFEQTGMDSLSEISVSAIDSERISEVAGEAKTLIQKEHGSSVKCVNMSEQAENAKRILSTFEMVISSVAVISLIIGGIGIMNTMLSGVNERTKEIGIKKAIGASDEDILNEFITESLLYSVIGAVLGIACGIILTSIASRFIGLNSEIKPPVVMVSVGFSVIVGMIFGIYPAKRASKLKVVEAIRKD